MTPEVKHAVQEIESQFPGFSILVADDRNGGACVMVEGVPLGTPYAQRDTWVGFHITYLCPYADTYPHFVRGDLSRLDGAQLGEGATSGHVFPQPGVLVEPGRMASREAVQVSRRSNHRDASGLETPRIKLLKVLEWLRSR